jgi:hypothetical protein
MRFAGLFNAARVLLKEQADEDRVLPTLGCEGLLTQESQSGWGELKASFVEAWQKPEVWESKKRELLERSGRIRPVEVIDGVLILERAPVAVKVWGGPEPEVWIEIMPRSKPATPEEVALVYEQVMKEHGIPHHEDRAVSGTSVMMGHHLRLMLKPVFVGFYISDSPPRGPFPTPALVGDFYRGFRQGSFGKRLTGRGGGDNKWKPDNLVPIVLAFFLRTYGGMDSRREINQILLDHVLPGTWKSHLGEHERTLFRGATPGTLTNQVWNNVPRVHKQLIRTMHSL